MKWGETVNRYVSEMKNEEMNAENWFSWGWLIFWILVFFPGAFLYIIIKASEKNASKQKQKKCPFCAELIKAEATMCRFCRSNLKV